MVNKKTENGTAYIEINNARYELPIYQPSIGPNVVDISKLYSQANVFTYDQALLQQQIAHQQLHL